MGSLASLDLLDILALTVQVAAVHRREDRPLDGDIRPITELIRSGELSSDLPLPAESGKVQRDPKSAR